MPALHAARIRGPRLAQVGEQWVVAAPVCAPERVREARRGRGRCGSLAIAVCGPIGVCSWSVRRWVCTEVRRRRVRERLVKKGDDFVIQLLLDLASLRKVAEV